MLKVAASFLVAVGLVVAWSGTQAGGQEKKGKTVTLKGTITCPKCDLGTEKACWTVIVVGEKKDVYYFDAGANKKYHEEICTGGKQGTVEGVVTVEGKKKTVKVSKVTFE